MHDGWRIGIAGLGLIGGSLARALAARRPGWTLRACDADAAAVAAACDAGVVHAGADTLDALLDASDIVVLCQPVPVLLAELARMAGRERLPVLCDAASVKGVVLDAAQALGRRRGRFVGAHPIAGGVASGWAAGCADLFEGRLLVTCEDGADADAVDAVRALWAATGARLHEMPAARHDEVYAAVSHVPQLLTWAYLGGLAQLPAADEALALAGPGYASFTRLAASNPALWAGIALNNRGPLLAALQAVSARLRDMQDALARGDGPGLQHLFLHAGSLAGPVHHPQGITR